MKEIKKPDEALRRFLPPVTPKPDITYIPSQFTLPFEHQGKRYVFHTLTRQLVEGALPAAARGGEGLDAWIESGFLVPPGRDECAYYTAASTMLRAYTQQKAVRGYVILPTLGCNARCVYCFEEGMKPVTMTKETAEQTVRFIRESCGGKKVSLEWFGGEPLLCPDTIDFICRGLREAGIEYTSGIVTNGSRVTPEIIEKMTGLWQLKWIQVSMDGSERDYIARKRYVSYHDEYRAVLQNIDLLSTAGITVSIRCNVDAENWAGVPAFLEDLKTAISHKEKVSLYFFVLFQALGSEDELPLWEKIAAMRPTIEAAGFRAPGKSGVGTGFRIHHCMADRNDIVIGPDGSLYPCENCPPEARFGDVWHGTTDAAAKEAFCRVTPVREQCRNCVFLPDCTGFSHCPIQETHCKERRMLLMLDMLHRMVERGEEQEAEETVC